MTEKAIAPEILDGFSVIDPGRELVGNVERVWVRADDDAIPEYYGIEMGLIRHHTHVIPATGVRIDFEHRAIWVPYRRDQIEGGPTFPGDEDLSPDAKQGVTRYYGHQAAEAQ